MSCTMSELELSHSFKFALTSCVAREGVVFALWSFLPTIIASDRRSDANTVLLSIWDYVGDIVYEAI